MESIRWGIVGCGDVTEVKSGPGFSRAENSTLVSVMRRNGELARDYAKRHKVPKWTDKAEELIGDPEVDAVYVATPPNAHRDYTIMCAEAGKPVLVEKPIATQTGEADDMVQACADAGVPLFVAYYRRAMPIYLKVKELIDGGRIGHPRTVQISHFEKPKVSGAPGEELPWRVLPEVGGGGIFVDIGCHAFDFLDFLFGPVTGISGLAANVGGLYPAEDLVTAAYEFDNGVHGSGEWCFTARADHEQTRIRGTEGEIAFSFFAPEPVILTTDAGVESFDIGYPKHVHQPLIQTVVDDLLGKGTCHSTGDSALRTTRIIDAVLDDYRTAG
jgi:predicted dehydrogenase